MGRYTWFGQDWGQREGRVYPVCGCLRLCACVPQLCMGACCLRVCVYSCVSQICVSILAASVNLSAAYVSATTPSTAVSWRATASLAWTLLGAGVVLVVALWVSFLRTCPDFVGPASLSPNAPSGAHR
jgi:hypothetical protein